MICLLGWQTDNVTWDVFGDFLGAMVRTAGRAMALDPSALTMADRFGWSVPIGIAVLAGVSIMVGQSILLAINRVSRVRGVLTLLASGVGTVLMAAIEASLVAVLGRLILGNSQHVADLLPTVLIAFAPYWLGFLVLLPYSGPGVARALEVWHLVALWLLLIPVLQAGRWSALLVAAAAWLATAAVHAFADNSPLRLRERVFRLASGTRGLTWRDVRASSRLEPQQ